MRLIFRIALSLGLGLVIVRPCLAGVAYRFVFDQSDGNYQTDSSGQIDVKVYLQESITAGSLGYLPAPGDTHGLGGATLSNTIGMQGAGVMLRYTSSQTASSAYLSGNMSTGATPPWTDASTNGPGDWQSPPYNTNSAYSNPIGGVSTLYDFVNPVYGDYISGGNGSLALYRVLIGTFHFTAPGPVGTQTQIEAQRLFPDGDFNVAANGTSLENANLMGADVTLAYAIITSNMTVSVVPEPSTFVAGVGMVVTVGGIVLARRRSQKRATRRLVRHRRHGHRWPHD